MDIFPLAGAEKSEGGWNLSDAGVYPCKERKFEY